MVKIPAAATTLLVLIALPACAASGHPAAVPSSQLTPAQARIVFDRFVTSLKQLQAHRVGTSGSQLLTGPEKVAQDFLHGPVGPVITRLTGQRVYVPRLSGYPRWFLPRYGT